MRGTGRFKGPDASPCVASSRRQLILFPSPGNMAARSLGTGCPGFVECCGDRRLSFPPTYRNAGYRWGSSFARLAVLARHPGPGSRLYCFVYVSTGLEIRRQNNSSVYNIPYPHKKIRFYNKALRKTQWEEPKEDHDLKFSAGPVGKGVGPCMGPKRIVYRNQP